MNVFLSYSSTNTEIAKRVAHLLKDEGDEVFFDRESLPLGETYDRRIREAIEDCERMFRETLVRVSTDNIGLARVGDGLELIRIGSPSAHVGAV